MVSPLKTLLESKLGSKINRTLTLVARDYYFKGGELRPHRQSVDKILRVRIFWLRDRGEITGVRRIVYLDPSENAYKNLESWATKRVVIGFFGKQSSLLQ